MKKKKQLAKKPDPWKEVRALHKRLENAKEPDPTDVERLRRLAAEMPGVLSFALSTTQSIQHELIRKISNGVSRAYMLAEVDKLKKDLGYVEAPPLERLIIDHILTVRLRLIYAEHVYNETVVEKSVTLALGVYRDNLLTSAQARFLRAIETLARVRRLARKTPALQINIARDGGKQVNVQGDVNGHKTPTAAAAQQEVTP